MEKSEFPKKSIEKSKTFVISDKASTSQRYVKNDSNTIIQKTFKKKVLKYYIDSIEQYFNSLETVQIYVYGAAKRDNFIDIWQKLGYDFKGKKQTFKYDKNAKEKKLTIYASGNGYAFGSDNGGNIFDFLERYKNLTKENAYQYIAKVYNLEYEQREISRFKPSNRSTNTNTRQNYNSSLQIDKKANEAYFEKVCKELNLPLDNSYFSLCENGFLIPYLDLDGNPIIDKVGRNFTRQRYFKPFRDNKGKTKKYNTEKGAGYFPYLTPLYFNPKPLETSNTLYSTEGEKKALYGVKELNLPFIGIGGIHLGTHTLKNEITGKSIIRTAEFLPQTRELIENEGITAYHLLFDGDTFENKDKDNRHLSFSTAVQKEFIAAQKVGIKKFTFSIVNPNNVHGAKGLDDLGQYYTPSEIKEKLQDNTHHNDLFWHFRLDTTKEAAKALYWLKRAFLASVVKHTTNEVIEITGKIGNQLTADPNSPFITALLSQKNIVLNAPTGLGKSFFVEYYLKPLVNDKNLFNSIIIFCSPRNSLSKQQAKDGILFTNKTNDRAIERLKTEIAQTGIVYSNFDNLKTAYETLVNLHRRNVIIVIDEYHLLAKDTNIQDRKKVINEVFEVLEMSSKNLFLSATPSALPLIDKPKVFDVIGTDKKPYNVPSLVFTKKKQRLECTLDCILKAIRKGKRVIAHYNSLDDCQALKKELESRKIKTRIAAAETKITGNDLDFLREIEKGDFIWNNDIDVILCTSILEVGLNLRTDRNVSMIFTNTSPYGFDDRSYIQFIARIRNYNEFEVTNTIIDTNKAKYLPSQALRDNFDFAESTEFAAQNVQLHNSQYEKIKFKYSEVQKDRFVGGASENICFNSEKEVFEIDKLSILQDYDRFEIEAGSPYFHNPSQVIFYEKEKESESLKKCVEEVQEEKQKAENRICELYDNDFYTLLASVFLLTKDNRLRTKCDIQANPNEPIHLNLFELEIAERLLKHHFTLAKTVKKTLIEDIEAKEIKSILIDKTTHTIHKTSDLAKRKKAYIAYFLLTSNSSQKRVRESLQVNEYNRLIENLSNRKLTSSELLGIANKDRYGKARYTQRSLLDVLNILLDFEVNRKVENGRKLTIYTIEGAKNFSLEMERLRE